jgi:hypothetical protein
MIKTLKKISNKSLKTGNAQVQSVTKDIVKNLSDSVEQQNLNIQKSSFFENSDVLDLLEKDEKQLVFEKASLTKNKAKLNIKVPNALLKNNIPDVFNKKFSAYEDLVGISQQRPEVISMVNFLPITNGVLSEDEIANWQNSDKLTKEGKYFLTQILANEIQALDVKYFFDSLSKSFPKIKSLLKTSNINFSSNISNVEEVSNFLFSVVEYVELLRESLDLRNTIYQISSQEKNVTSTATSTNKINPSKLIATNVSALQNILNSNVFSLLENFGFNKANVSNFSSTKLWIQTLHETKNCLLNYSDNFNEEKSAKKLNDKNAYSTLIEEKKYFSINNGIYPVEFFLGVEENILVDLSVSQISNFWKNIYRNLKHSDSEFVISNLLNFCSKEVKYSNALSDKTTSNLLLLNGYQISQNNDEIFDFVIGNTDFSLSKVQQNNADENLVNLAFSVPEQDVAVLLFETRYIENQKNIYTPGYEYYVDSIYDVKNEELNLEKFNVLLNKLNKSNSRTFNLLSSLEVVDESNSVEISTAQTRSVVYNIDSFFSYFISNICSSDGSTNPKLLADDIAGIYSLAKKDLELKSLLFLLSLFKSILGIDSQSFNIEFLKKEATLTPNSINHIIDRIVDRVIQISDTTKIVSDKITTRLTAVDVRQSLKKGTYVSKTIDDFLKFYYSMFNQTAFVDGKTKFRQVQDTAMLMALFDVCINCVSEFSNKSLKSVVLDPAQLQLVQFVFDTKNIKHFDKLKSIKTRLTNETNIQKNSVSFIFDTLNKLQQNFNSAKSLITSDTAKKTFSKINSALGNSVLFKSLMSEQQIHLIVSNLRDIVEISNTKKDISSDEAFEIIDEAIIDAKLKNALLSVFSDNRFNEENGFNKKIISVGIPNGFAQNLNLKTDNNFNTFSKEKTEKDIITLNVYKVDLQNPDVIYSPNKFLFELSRFPVRNSKHYSDISQNSSLVDICSAIPTRDFSQDTITDAGIYYYNKNNGVIDKTKKAAFSNSNYSFLTFRQKEDIAINHVLSYFYEVYIKIMTNMNISDYSFALDSQQINKINKDVLKDISNSYFDLIKNKTQQPQQANKQLMKLFSSMNSLPQTNNSLDGFKKTVNNVVSTTTNNLAQGKSISQKLAPTYMHGVKILDSASKLTTTLINDVALIKTLLTPKKFDRVFHVAIDPDDFEINYNETIKTQQGKVALEQLIKRGDVLQTGKNGSFKYRDRTRTRDDIVLEKYFVSVQTFGEESV